MQDQDKTWWPRRQFWMTVFVVWVTFLVYSFCHAPIPGANEPHYLCKAKHYWQPEWCPRDFFLTSSNPHLMFYIAVGWLARWCSLDVIAVLTRGAGYLLLAVGWTRFSRAFALTPRLSIVSVWLMLVINSSISLSGEWLVGGIESKVIAYACVLSGLADGLNGRWALAGLQLGLAVAFHPLVGLWSVIAAGAGTLWSEWRAGRIRLPSPPAPLPGGPERRGRVFGGKLSLIAGLVLLLATSMAGIVPAMSAVLGQSSQDSYTASFIQVFYRLSHHLDPMQFPWQGYAVYVLLLAVGCYLSLHRIPQREYAWLRNFIIAAAGIAFVGWLAGLGPRPHPEHMPLFELRMTALKFYPFRLADAVVPMFFVLTLVSWFSDRVPWSRRPHQTLRRFEIGVGILLFGALAYGFGVGSARYLPDDRETDWLDVCRWAKANTPADTLFITPNESWGFKWFAERAEYVAFKDCPQDPKSLIEWNNRLRWLRRWADAGFADGRYSAEEVIQVRDHTQAEFFISRELAKLEAPVVYANSTYTIYALGEPSAATPSSSKKLSRSDASSRHRGRMRRPSYFSRG